MLDRLVSEGLEELHFRNDPQSGLKAIIAIHSTSRGPALGGCRFIEYETDEQALADAIRLARGMSFKAALANVPQGGGKSVIMKPVGGYDEKALFQAFGDFVESLGGRYITAVDSGTTSAIMDVVATRSGHVTSTTEEGNPSGYTADGVLHGIRAAVRHRLGRDTLKGLHVAIQGVGNVGEPLARALHREGARLTLADVDEQRVRTVARETGGEVVSPDAISAVACDIFAPCGLGGALNRDSIAGLRCDIVAGSANNQLKTVEDGGRLHERGILYAPDYVINAGGLIHCSLNHLGTDASVIRSRTAQIADTLTAIFERADAQSRPTSEVADALARERLAEAGRNPWHPSAGPREDVESPAAHSAAAG